MCGCLLQFASLGESKNVWWQKDVDPLLGSGVKRIVKLDLLKGSSLCFCVLVHIFSPHCNCGHSFLYCKIDAIKGTIEWILPAMCMAACEFSCSAEIKLNAENDVY